MSVIVWVVVISLFLSALVFEYFSLQHSPQRLLAQFKTDLALSEPGEQVCLTMKLQNTGRLPILFISASIRFEDGLRAGENDEATASCIRDTASGFSFRRRYFLLPHQAVTEKIRFHADRRGIYRIGRCYLECGDFLGLRSAVRSIDVGERLVCTARYDENLPEFQPLGGTDGDFSVQRYIFEDPTLVYGYRDYTGREPMKQISWKATARAGRMIVRVLDHTLNRNATVLADLRTAAPEHLEHTLELVRTACERLEEMHIPYALITNSDLGEIPEGLGRQHIHMIQRKIGVSRPIAYYNFDRLLPRLLATPAKSRNFILIAPEPTERTEMLLRQLDRHGAAETLAFYGKEAAS